MGTFKSTYIAELMMAIGVILLIFSDRNLLVTHYFLGGKSNIVYMSVLFILAVVSFLIGLAITQGHLYFRYRQRGLLLVSLVLALYFFAHEFAFGDSLVSAKYTVFLLIISLSLMINFNLFFVFKIIGYIGGIICLLIIIQQAVVLGLTEGELSQFDVSIPGELWGRWNNCDFVTPYGLGMFERCEALTPSQIFGFNVNRSLFFSTEPKYISSMLLVTLGSLLISRAKVTFKFWILGLHVLALLLVFSASAILIVVGSLVMVYFRCIGAFTYSALVFLVPLFVLPVMFEFALQISGLDGFLLQRVSSGAGSAGEFGMQEATLFGEAFGNCREKICRDSKGLLGNLYGTWGLVGLSIFWIYLFQVISPMFRLIRSKGMDNDILVKMGLMVFINTYVVFNIYFFGDLFNMFGVMILLSLILLPSYISKMINTKPRRKKISGHLL